MDFETIRQGLQHWRDSGPAILSADRPALDHGQLCDFADEVLVLLNGHGLGRGDRVAIVLDNGPEMASAFVSIATACATAPLNPAYGAEELRFYLTDLKPKAIVLGSSPQPAALQIARELGLPIVKLDTRLGGASGRFELSFPPELDGKADRPGPTEPDDLALLLHTSGTTSRPKVVPLTQRNLAVSAQNIARTLGLRPEDRCLNIMPLFHIHGLVGATLSSLLSGGSIYCTTGFNALRFMTELEHANPTWITAVPTMYQAVLPRAERQKEQIRARKLRFLRSSSASLPPQVMAALEDVFGCPVIESYGMTEASHQMTSNPLPPARRKPGSVGIAAGPEVGIMDEDGRLLEKNEIGEIVIRGANVTLGYENNPEANAKAFTNGWFRTGDQGTLDAEGYLHITGRLKEIINRGGEKVSPREVDEVLMDHPAIQQVVTFAIPHEKLGEEVAAAVVLREGAALSEVELRRYAAERLADFKVPRKVVFLSEIPKGATGKLQRIGLAQKLGLT